MKQIIITLLFITSGLISSAGNIDTASFEVSGICNMCKDRIENAAYIKGVKKATWDKETQMLTVIFKPNKVTVQQIAASVAEAGHDNAYVTCTEEQYLKVHNCCRYRENEVH